MKECKKLKDEIWRDVKGFEGFYQVSNLGNVRSLDRVIVDAKGITKTYKGKMLTPCDAGKGYRNVMMVANGKRSTPRLCRVVATAFIPNPLNLPQVNHIDEDKSNDAADNLEWCSAKYNTCYGTGIKRRTEKISRPVNQFSQSGELIKTWESIAEAERITGIDNSHIVRCCRGKLQKTGGYKWQYADNTHAGAEDGVN